MNEKKIYAVCYRDFSADISDTSDFYLVLKDALSDETRKRSQTPIPFAFYDDIVDAGDVFKLCKATILSVCDDIATIRVYSIEGYISINGSMRLMTDDEWTDEVVGEHMRAWTFGPQQIVTNFWEPGTKFVHRGVEYVFSRQSYWVPAEDVDDNYNEPFVDFMP